jgi:predicted amidophosphoribosyltransferase
MGRKPRRDRPNFKRKQMRCCYCGKPAVPLRMWCSTCLARVRYCGVVDLPDYPTQNDARRLRALVDA